MKNYVEYFETINNKLLTRNIFYNLSLYRAIATISHAMRMFLYTNYYKVLLLYCVDILQSHRVCVEVTEKHDHFENIIYLIK